MFLLLIQIVGCSNTNSSDSISTLEKIEERYKLPVVSEYIDHNDEASNSEKFLKLEKEDIEEYKSALLEANFEEELIQGIDGQQFIYRLENNRNNIKVSIVDSAVTDTYISIRFNK